MLTLLSCSDKFATLELTHSLLLLEFHRLLLISGKCVTQLIRSQVATGRRMEVRHLSHNQPSTPGDSPRGGHP